ncbi:MotA/TolQ/ExbB proton channel family protein [Desulfatibacillum aliphaticivorans]|uniref:MotA/TolQ/ExbB proton channel family protein n=1 Tax=Desulfatibacillum aliphaticivorans TaxID=218208 RepID=UPI0014711683|nr:MotA/TolQ/ExbB proton channel family protein [Desulfatibacillum aliphaticivorans]
MTWIDDLLPIEPGVNYHQSWVDSCVDQVWLEYETEISSQVASIGGVVNSAILLGFFGTIYGTIFAFQEMTKALSTQNVVATQAISQAFEGGLNTALLTSLLSSAIGAVIIFFLAVRTQPRLKAFEKKINHRISSLLKCLMEADANPDPAFEEKNNG